MLTKWYIFSEKSTKPDPVTLMMEKIAHSKNPAEATAAMVAALATSSKLGNQRKLLLELTKKVDEQKRLLEQKRISAKLGQSPSGSSPCSSSTAVSNTNTSSLGISSKDPRLRAQNAATLVNASNTITSEPMDLDLRIPGGGQVPVGVPPPSVSVPVGVPPPLGVSTPTVSVSLASAKQSSVLPSSITASALEKSVSILSSLTSEIASGASSPRKIKEDNSAKSVTSVLGTVSPVLNEGKTGLKPLSGGSSTIVKPTGFYVSHENKEKDTAPESKILSDNVSKSQSSSEDSSEVSHSGKNNEADKSDCVGSSAKLDKEKSQQGAQHEIITQLMAEVSGKATADSKTDEKQHESKNSEILLSEDKNKTLEKDQIEQGTSRQVPNVAALFKGLAKTNAGNSETGRKSGIQLPSALMSLFSKLPGSAEEPKEVEMAKIPGLFTADTEEPAEDTDLRQSDKSPGEISDTKPDKEQKDLEDKNSKHFLGFNYDSDSSGGSFEGFDDDGTKKLSPRKRKLVQKSPRALSPSKNSPKTNLFGDTDERDVDFRQKVEADVDLRKEFGSESKAVDERLPTIHMTTANGQPLPPGEGPVHPLPLPPSLRLPFIPSSQPLPPGFESDQPPPPGVAWEHGTPTSIPVGMTNIPPATGDWGPPLPDSQPPLPAEPPMPKPPEPPMKKKKAEDEGARKEDDESDDGESRYQSKNSKKKKKKKERKNKKGGPVASDERLKQIVLEIAKKEPIEPPPLPPMVPHIHGMPFDPPQQMMPLPAMGVPVPHVSMTSAPVTSQLMSGIDIPAAGNSSWMKSDHVGRPLNTLSKIMPPNLPAHLQPGVVPNAQHFRPMPDPSGHQLPIINKDRPPGSQMKPPSLLDLPDIRPASKLMTMSAEMASISTSGSPSVSESRSSTDDVSFGEREPTLPQQCIVPTFDMTETNNQGVPLEQRCDQEDRSRERDRDERRRRDRHRSRSGDRSRRSRSGDRRYRSRSHERESDRHHRERSHDHDRHHYRDSRDRDRDRERSRGRDRVHRRH